VRLKSFLIPSVSFFLLFLFAQSAAAQADKACDLPRDLQGAISSKYQGKKIVGLSDLCEDDRGLFQKDHGKACPGVINVDFYGDGKPTLALVLIAKGGAKGKAELVVAHRVGGSWSTTLLDRAKDSIPVVWSQEPGKYQDVYGKKELRAARPVVVFCQYEAWAILYAWTDKHVSKIWLSD
jgi:hypothetical protein